MGKKRNTTNHGAGRSRPLFTHPPASPLDAERGEWREEDEPRQVWFAFCVAQEQSFEVLVSPEQVIMRTRRGRDGAEFCRITHEGFAMNSATRQWVSAVFGSVTLSEVDAEISRLAKRAETGGVPYGADIWKEDICNFEGRCYPGIRRTTVQTRTSAFLTGDEVIVDHWWYHPQYDEEPNTRVERFCIADFMCGAGQAEVLESFGTRALDRLLAECRSLRPTQRVRDIRCDIEKPGKLSWTWLTVCTERLSQLIDRLVSLPTGAGGALILLLIAAGTAYLMAAPLSWWWHGRVADDLLAVPALIVSHETIVEKREISNGPKRSSKGIRYVYTPLIGFSVAVLPPDMQSATPLPLGLSTSRDMPEFPGSKETRTWMSENHPVGQERTLRFRPHEADLRKADFILSSSQIPNGWDLLRELLIDVLLTTFIYLPLVVLAAMGIGIAISALLSGWRRTGG